MAASETTLGLLHEELAKALLARIADGTATAADMAVARGMLKDNRISCIPKDDGAIGELEKRLQEKQARKQKPALVGGTAVDIEAIKEAAGFMISNG